jgi:predicted  nucleic acid-binding Zn-ribbon protein
MEVKDFCSAMESEMTSWKAKMYDAMRKIDQLGTAEKEKMLMNIQDLNMLMDDMAKRVEQLRTECPSDWSPIKQELEQGTLDMRGKYEEAMESIGKAAPVSIPG